MNLVVAFGLLAALALAAVMRVPSSIGSVVYTAYQADINKDGVVNPGDQAIVASKVGQHWTPTPTATYSATPPATATPEPTQTPPPWEANLAGPTHGTVGSVVTYTITIRNRGLDAADARTNSFFLHDVHTGNSMLNVLCVTVGFSAGNTTGCTDETQFNAAGVNGNGYGGVIQPGESVWASFTGVLTAATDQTPFLAEATWHFNGSSAAASDNTLVVVSVDAYP